jgi:hypothetical protein
LVPLADKRTLKLAALAVVSLIACVPGHAQQAAPDEAKRVDHDTVSKADEDDIARESENPIGNLPVLPFENYTNFGVGPHDGTQNILEFEPVVPIHLNQDWNLINRAVIPVVWNPDLSPFPSVPQAFAPTDYSAFLSPRNLAGGWTVGSGPIVQFPTATSPTVGSSVWGLGPTAVVVHTSAHIVTGLLVNQVWSLGGVESVRAASVMRRSSRSPSSITISATAGLSPPRPLSPTTKPSPDGNGRCPSAGSRVGSSSLGGKLPVKLEAGPTTMS